MLSLQHGTGRRSILIRPIKDSVETNERSSCYMVYTKELPKLADAIASRSIDRQKEVFAEIFEAFPGSLRERALQGMWAAKDFYVSQTAQIKLPVWSQGRVVLIGDSAYAPSPATGQGTALAIIGAYLVAGELATIPNDPVLAFREYDRKLLRRLGAEYTGWQCVAEACESRECLGCEGAEVGFLACFVVWIV